MKDYKEAIAFYLKMHYGKTPETAAKSEVWFALSSAIMTELQDQWKASEAVQSTKKQAYYLSAEFLMGRALGNNLINLGIESDVEEALKAYGLSLNDIEEAEEDAGLGNGGLGRLAACFLDSAATLDMPLQGYGIRYDYGIFKQYFEDGFQKETADDWQINGDPWSIRRADEAVNIEFTDESILAVPYDTPVIGYGGTTINTLRLWRSESTVPFDFDLFNAQDYDAAVEKKNRAEDISRVLYPNDSTDAGKKLRLKQQYFFVSASLQDRVSKFKAAHGNDFNAFPEYHAIQLNDTHPVVAIPELMRLLVDGEGCDIEMAWSIAQKTFAYTNHTILAEALEKWQVSFYEELLPRVLEIIQWIDARFEAELLEKAYAPEKIETMRMISNGVIHMAYLAIYGSHTINGVAALHTEILKEQALHDWYLLYPERFQNKTNGITQRRWIRFANPELSALITSCLGTEAWVKNLDLLKGLNAFADDETVLRKFIDIKHHKKQQLADYIRVVEGIEINPDSLFDIQIKRLHEYKRQLLSAFQILYRYFELKENPEAQVVPRTYIFGAKAAPGYFRAKAIIKFINEIGKLVNHDPDIAGRIKVVFVSNYRVSYAEKLFPAADLSEQISTAGKEASGTGNMKFMLNGTPTIGTMDGANVEIVEEAGAENNYIFGAKVEEIEAIKDTYNPRAIHKANPKLRKVIDTLIDGTFDDGGSGMFEELYDALLVGASWHAPDNYFILHDFDSYVEAQNRVSHDYNDALGWARKAWINIAGSGKFSSDRTIEEYAQDIWQIEAIEV